jgi:hypothetical protein
MGITHLEVRRHPTWQLESQRPNSVPVFLAHSGRARLVLTVAVLIVAMTVLVLR